jgi:transketolase
VPNFTDPEQPFEIGKAYVMNEGKDVTVFCCGHLVWEALQAAEALEAEGISVEVVNVATIKPIDEDAVVASVRKTGKAIVAEEHNMAGGLGEAIAGVLARKCPAPLAFMNGEDRFGQTGKPAELMALYGLDAAHIAGKVREIVK